MKNRFNNPAHSHMNQELFDELNSKGYDLWEDANFNWMGINKDNSSWVAISYDLIKKEFSKPMFFSIGDLEELNEKVNLYNRNL